MEEEAEKIEVNEKLPQIFSRNPTLQNKKDFLVFRTNPKKLDNYLD